MSKHWANEKCVFEWHKWAKSKGKDLLWWLFTLDRAFHPHQLKLLSSLSCYLFVRVYFCLEFSFFTFHSNSSIWAGGRLIFGNFHIHPLERSADEKGSSSRPVDQNRIWCVRVWVCVCLCGCDITCVGWAKCPPLKVTQNVAQSQSANPTGRIREPFIYK